MAMRLSFETDNAAFGDDNDTDRAHECARILRLIASQIERGSRGGQCVDLNGNKVGSWELERQP